jgi:LAS superfamily LD-carboxypeptidase LdcB
MKKIALAFLVMSLSGCALIDAYFMAKYDTNEYALINKIRTTAQIAQKSCDKPLEVKPQINDIIYTSTELRNFTQHIPRNPEAYKMAGQMVELSEQIKFDEKTSPVFCKMKLQQVERNAEKIQHVLGSKPR